MKYLQALLAITLLGLTGAAPAQTSLTLYLGYAASDGIENTTTNSTAKIESGVNYSAALDFPLDAGRQLQLFYSQQKTQLDPGAGLAPFDLTVRYLHIGGTLFLDGPPGTGPYLVGGIGATQLSPSLVGLDSEIKASMNLGLGYQWVLAKNLALRAEGRAFMTLINSSGNLFCSGGCVVTLKGDLLLQGAAMVGISGRF